MFTQENKTALVTGASSGMGKAIAHRLIKEGYQVYAAARHIEKMDDLAAPGAQTLRMDISNEEEILSGVKMILAHTGGVDVLVNNAGFGLYGPVEEISIDIVKRSATGPYGHLVQMVATAIKKTYGQGKGSDPAVVADVVSKAVKGKNPRTRYAVGKFAKLLIGMRVWLGDRLFDRIILSQMR